MKTYLVKFDIGGGWFIECQMRGLDAQHAEALAEHSLRRRFIQWGGQQYQTEVVEVQRPQHSLSTDIRFADMPRPVRS